MPLKPPKPKSGRILPGGEKALERLPPLPTPPKRKFPALRAEAPAFAPAAPEELPPDAPAQSIADLCALVTVKPGSKKKRPRLEEVEPDRLSQYIERDASLVARHGFATFVQERRGRDDFGKLRMAQHHPAGRLLRNYKARGAPVVLSTAPWTTEQQDQALDRGSHKSAEDHIEFLRTEMADMVEKSQWTVLPLSEARKLKGLRLSPLGVVPQANRRPRTIVDYSFNGVNADTQPIVAKDAMQFGRALERIVRKIVLADPKYGPVNMLKIDIADGFYRVGLSTDDIPKLGVVFPSEDGAEQLVALPLTLPMGWTNSPPIFCAATETVADLANQRILKGRKLSLIHI